MTRTSGVYPVKCQDLTLSDSTGSETKKWFYFEYVFDVDGNLQLV